LYSSYNVVGEVLIKFSWIGWVGWVMGQNFGTETFWKAAIWEAEKFIRVALRWGFKKKNMWSCTDLPRSSCEGA
jgi:hypothetical protein